MFLDSRYTIYETFICMYIYLNNININTLYNHLLVEYSNAMDMCPS